MSEETIINAVFSSKKLEGKSKWFLYGYAEYVHEYENHGLVMENLPDYTIPSVDDEEFGNGWMFASQNYGYSDAVVSL